VPESPLWGEYPLVGMVELGPHAQVRLIAIRALKLVKLKQATQAPSARCLPWTRRQATEDDDKGVTARVV